jgi:hypothetical protein
MKKNARQNRDWLPVYQENIREIQAGEGGGPGFVGVFM